MQQTKMSPVFLACLLFLLAAGAQAKEKQIKLEDIERDNLAAERNANAAKQQQLQGHQSHQGLTHLNQHSGYQSLGPLHRAGNYYLPNLAKTHNYQTHPTANGRHQLPQQHQHERQHHVTNVHGTPTPPKMQYGFVPIKTPTYHQQASVEQPTQHVHAPQVQQVQHVQYKYVTPSHTQAYLPPNQPGKYASGTDSSVAPGLQAPRIQYAVHHQEDSPPPSKYAVPIQTQAYQQYIQNQAANAAHASQAEHATHSGHNAHTQIQYIPESQLAYYQYQTSQQQTHQQHSQPQSHPQHRIQYVVDNSIQTDPQAAPQEEQKYYQQFVYIQPYQTSSASSNIHSVADTKGNVQYVMYIPAGATYPPETVLAYPTHPGTQYVYQPVLEEQVPGLPNPKSPGFTEVTGAHTPSGASIGTQYDIPAETPKIPKTIERPVFKHQPTSLLDSYVPSYLQYQYYKQQQTETANAIKHPLKLSSADVGKTDILKTYKGESSSY